MATKPLPYLSISTNNHTDGTFAIEMSVKDVTITTNNNKQTNKNERFEQRNPHLSLDEG